jgi:hypothetical protein
MLVIGYWLSAFSYWLLAVGSGLLEIDGCKSFRQIDKKNTKS